MFMLRKGRWKLVVYPGYQDQLFDMDADPDEMHDLAQSDAHKIVLSQMHSALAGVLDTDKVNERAFADQEKRIAELGGREAILALKNFDHTPVS
jgi:choline-sulfatase